MRATSRSPMSDISQVFEMADIFIFGGYLNTYPCDPLPGSRVSFYLKVYFWLPKSPFKPLFDAILKRFIHYIEMFLRPDPHSP